MNLGIDGRTALVTGASRGLGRAISEALAAEGARVAMVARSEQPLRDTAAGIGGLPFPADLASLEGRSGAFSRLREAAVEPDILVINTGGPPGAVFDDTTASGWREEAEKLLHFSIEAVGEFLPAMRRRQWGRILLVTSIAAREPLRGLTYSNVLRAGLHGLVKDLSHEVAEDGVTVNALMPGYIRTERITALDLDEPALEQSIPMRRLGTVEEFASLACYLASRQAAYITGQAIAVDGGLMRGF